MYDAFAKREAAGQLNARRNAVVAGVYANTNMDSQKEGQEPPRKQMLEQVDASFDAVLAAIYGVKQAEVKLDEDPFFAAMKLPPEIEAPLAPGNPTPAGPLRVDDWPVEVDEG
jgi:hypothetical protein